MAASGARAQKPVGSAAWISTEKENFTNLLNQEMEEVEYPVRHEMDWLNEHMAEIFSNNQFNFTEAFKTPGKLRGKTPRTARKRDPAENRVPLSEIFSTSHNRFEDKVASPTPHRSPAKQKAPVSVPTPAPAAATPTKPKHATENAPRLQYPDLSKDLNSLTTYNTDSGYHEMPDEGEEEEDDDVVLTQVQPESQTSTQPFDSQPTPKDVQEHRSSISRRSTAASFHSAHEDVQQRGNTVEPMQIDSTPKEATKEHTPQPLPKAKEPEPKPETEVQPEPEPEPEVEPEVQSDVEPDGEDDAEPEAKEPTPALQQEAEQVEEPEAAPETQLPKTISSPAKSSPMKTSAPQPSEPREEVKDDAKDDMALDDENLDDIGSPSDGSTPDRPLIRKSSLSFASLPAREPLMKKSLGGSRISRTSHIVIAKINNTGGSGFLGRQTGGHRSTQAALDENATNGEKMDLDDDKQGSQEDTDADTKASKLHNKSSTQRLHEKISMLGKLQPSRPTKSIPAVQGLSSTQVTYPELPSSKADTKPETASQKSHGTPAPEPMETEDDDWIRPFGSPSKANFPRGQTADAPEKRSGVGASHATDHDDAPAARKESAASEEPARSSAKQGLEAVLGKYSTPTYSSPQRPSHQAKVSTSHLDSQVSTTPAGSPLAQDGLVSASKSRLQSIVRSAKGLFTNSGGVAAAARMEASSPDEHRVQRSERVEPDRTSRKVPQPTRDHSPPRQEGRRTRSSTEREERRKQKELEDRQREEEEEQAERARQQEKERQRAAQLKAAQEKLSAENESRKAPVAPTPQKMSQLQKHSSREPEPSYEAASKPTARPSVSQQQSTRQRPPRPTRETLQKPKPQPQPVSIRVGSALSRHIPLASSSVSGAAESSVPAPTPASASKQPTLKKKASNSSLHTASSNSSFKSSVSSQTQRKAQLASERKREQEEREARRREEQRRELERKRAAQQQEETRRQEMRSRAEAERRERLASEDPKKAAQMQAIEKRRLENARRLERQGSQQPEMNTTHPPERPASQAARPASRLGSMQPYNRTINPPQPNPAKPPKRGLDDEPGHRSAAPKPGTMQPSGETKRRRTEDEHNPVMRPTMAPPIRQSNIRKESMIRKEPTKPSMYGHAQPGSSIFKTAQSQRPAHPMDMAKYASGKIPFAEPSNAPQPATHKTPVASSSAKKSAHKPSPNYPNGENIHLPEIATDSEDEDSDAEMLPVPKWAQPKELESLLRQQEGLEADSIFGPIAPFSLEETFKSDKRIKKFRERTSSANWAGTDALTQEEIRRDLAERQRLRLNGGWSFN
ncbi:inner centromere protein [Aspergillus flavus AF70]|nr:inner centromere protein [Aspergillus flavus AF70]